MLDKENRPDTDVPVKTENASTYLKKGSRHPPYRPGKVSSSAPPKIESKEGQARKSNVKSESRNESRPISRTVMQEVNQQAQPADDEKHAVPQATLPLRPNTPSLGKPSEKPEAQVDNKDESINTAASNDESPERYIPPAQRVKTPEVAKLDPSADAVGAGGSKTAKAPEPDKAPQYKGSLSKHAATYESPPSGPTTPKRQYARHTYNSYSPVPGSYYIDYQGAYQQPTYPPYTPHPNYYDPSGQYPKAIYPYYPAQYTEPYEYQAHNAAVDPRYEMSYNSSQMLSQRALAAQQQVRPSA